MAVSVLLERINLEKEIDVFQTVKQLRLCRSHLVDNLVSGLSFYLHVCHFFCLILHHMTVFELKSNLTLMLLI